jgi:hypothetical protein
LDGEPRASGDAEEARWFTKQEVGHLPLPPDTQDVIRKGFEKTADTRN